MEGAAIVAEARDWLGTPFVHQGYLRSVGCDCIGLVIGVALALGIVDATAARRDPRYNGYGRSPNPALLMRACDEYLEPIAEPELGAVLLMRFTRHPQHFALVSRLDPTYIIHAHQQAGRVVEHILDARWQRRVLRVFRLKPWRA